MSSYSTKRKKAPVKSERVPVNPKYQHIQSSLDTGASISKHDPTIAIRRERRRREPFARVSAKRVYEALVAAEGGERPFLLVDARSELEHGKCCIMDSVVCNEINLNRDRLPTELFIAKTKSEALVVYDLEDGDESHVVANRLMQKDWPKVAVLTGGITAIAKHFPILLDGTPSESMLAGMESKESVEPATSRRAGGGGGRTAARVGGTSKSIDASAKSFASFEKRL